LAVRRPRIRAADARGHAGHTTDGSLRVRLSPPQEGLKLGACQVAEEHRRPLAADAGREPDPLRRAGPARVAVPEAGAAGFFGGRGADPGVLRRAGGHRDLAPPPAVGLRTTAVPDGDW